jgi:hypothetical protein
VSPLIADEASRRHLDEIRSRTTPRRSPMTSGRCTACASGYRPGIHVRIVELPWLEPTATRPGEVLRIGRAIVAEWLDVGEADLDVELETAKQ